MSLVKSAVAFGLAALCLLGCGGCGWGVEASESLSGVDQAEFDTHDADAGAHHTATNSWRTIAGPTSSIQAASPTDTLTLVEGSDIDIAVSNITDTVLITAASGLARDSELDAKTVGSGTDHAVPRQDGTSGDLQDSGVTIDDSDNLTVPGGTIDLRGAPTCLLGRNATNTDDVACELGVVGWTCEADTNGICGDAT